jgi:hypothetical protein
VLQRGGLSAPPGPAGSKGVRKMFGILKSPSGEEKLVVQRYTIEMFLGPNFIPNKPVAEQPGIAEHLLYFAKLILEGYVLIAGPYRAFDGAYVVLSEKVTTYEQAAKIMEGDPWNRMGMSVAVVRTLSTNPVPAPKAFTVEPPPAGGVKVGARTAGAGRKAAATKSGRRK